MYNDPQYLSTCGIVRNQNMCRNCIAIAFCAGKEKTNNSDTKLKKQVAKQRNIPIGG